ncbi:MAG: ABC transporter permease [Syntrophales bacterium]|jgi:osmoprotectant transport system permease protein|nr:ABC transporter permease [Syntrophales bacterium]MDY0044385.1 ABC transporter permease [Syntrophales bacterium]
MISGVFHFISENFSQALYLSWEHMWIVGVALLISAAAGIPLGLYVAGHEEIASPIINGANIIMTIPSIALFGIMLPLLSPINLGLGKIPAIIALILYSQLPIIRNTFTAIKNLPPDLVDAADGMGMTRWQRLKEVEMPLAAPVIIAGLRTAAVMNIGIAAIAVYIGSGGLGVYIQQGIDRFYPEMILSGALLVSVLALIVDGIMAWLERAATPEGIKIQRKLMQ